MSEPKGERPARRNGNRTSNNGGMRFSRGLFGWFLFLALCAALFLLLNNRGGQYISLNFGDVLHQLQEGNVKLLSMETDQIKGEFRQPVTFPGPGMSSVTRFRADVPPGSLSQQLGVYIVQNRGPADLMAENSQNLLVTIIVPLIPWLLIFAFVWFFIFRQLRNSASAGGMLGNFGRSRHRITSKEHTNVTFDDVAGIEEAKEEVMEIVEFLKNPKKFQRLGGRIPRGVLLVGEPGTG